MKKRNKKRLLRVTLGVLCFAVIGGTVACAKPTDDSSVEIPPDTPVTELPEYFETYAVGETLAIRNYTWNVDGENVLLYGALVKDGTTYASVTPEIAQCDYSFTQTGDYNLVWYYVKDGMQTIVKNVEFSVGYQPYFNVAFASDYLTNETISLTAECLYDGQSFDAAVSVLSPYNETIDVSDMELTFADNGKYKVTYSADIDGTPFVRDYYLTVSGRAQYYKDYINPVSGVTSTTEGFTAPDYVADYIDSPEDEAKATGGKGVLVVTEGKSSFRFRNIVDFNGLDKTTDLIKFALLGSDGYSPVTGVEIKLIDVYDAENTIAINLNRVNNTMAEGQIQWVYTKIRYKGSTYAINSRGGMYVNSAYGIGTNLLFDTDLLTTDPFVSSNQAQAVGKVPWGQYQFDYEDKAFYVYTGQYNSKISKKAQTKILDLDDPAQVGKDNEWGGFTTGEAYIQIELQSNGSNVGFLLQEIAGEKLYAENDNDKAPSVWFEEETNGALPKGLANKFYPFAAATYSLDVIDGKVFQPEYEIVRLQKEVLPQVIYTDIEFEKKGFTPTSTGRYIVTYKIEDQDGNASERELYFDIVDDLGEFGLTYNYELPEKFTVGKYFTVPELTKKGFSYISESKESIIYNGVDYGARTNEQIFLDKAGTIEFKCTYKDFLGEEYTYEKSYPVEVSATPIANILGTMPKYVIKGRTIVLPDLSAIDFGKNPNEAGYNASWSLQVDGANVDTKERTVTVTKNHGETMQVRYLVGNVEAYAYEVKVVDAKYLSDRFYVVAGGATATNTKDYVSLTATADATVEYINPMLIDDSIVSIPVVFAIPDDNAAFDSIDVYFEDQEQSQTSLFVRITKNANGVYAQLNGEGNLYPLAKAEDGTYEFAYTVGTKAFTFDAQNAVKSTVTGGTFNGFTSNMVNVKFVFNGVETETAFHLYRLSTLQLKSLYESDGTTLQEYVDKTVPLLISEKTFRDNEMTFGSTMVIPAIEARTVLSGLATARVTVYAPSGKKVLDNVNAYNDNSFVIDEVGSYRITYSVAFMTGTRNLNYYFRVYQENLPVVSLSKDLQETYKAGTKLTVPQITVSNSENYTVSYYLVMPDYSRKLVEAGEEIVLSEYGSYRLEVIVTDEHNVSYTSWTFKVED